MPSIMLHYVCYLGPDSYNIPFGITLGTCHHCQVLRCFSPLAHTVAGTGVDVVVVVVVVV